MSDRSDTPAWDGDGTDPWMPARLDAIADAAESERDAYAAYWSALAGWLAAVAVAVDATGDPVTIRSFAPAWDAAMDDFADTLTDISERAYTSVTGEPYSVDMRQSALNRTWARRNQLSALPDEVYTRVQRATANAVRDGRSGDRLAADIRDVFDTTDTPYWRNRATTVARTESVGALNGGRADGQHTIARRLGGDFERLWVSTLDSRTRPTHQVADGQRAPLDGVFSVGAAQLRWPGDPFGPPEEIIQCRCTTVMVRPGQTRDFSRRA